MAGHYRRMDYEYVRPYICADGKRKNTGIKYYRVTGPTAHKEVYDPDAAKDHGLHELKHSCITVGYRWYSWPAPASGPKAWLSGRCDRRIPSLTFEPGKFRSFGCAKFAERHLGDTLNLV